jgi:hypothetical protein
MDGIKSSRSPVRGFIGKLGVATSPKSSVYQNPRVYSIEEIFGTVLDWLDVATRPPLLDTNRTSGRHYIFNYLNMAYFSSSSSVEPA